MLLPPFIFINSFYLSGNVSAGILQNNLKYSGRCPLRNINNYLFLFIIILMFIDMQGGRIFSQQNFLNVFLNLVFILSEVLNLDYPTTREDYNDILETFSHLSVLKTVFDDS